MSFELIEQLQQKAVPVEQLCRALQVSRSGYYAAYKRRRMPASIYQTSVELKAAFAASRGVCGSRRLCTALPSRGIVMGPYRVRRLMRQHGLR